MHVCRSGLARAGRVLLALPLILPAPARSAVGVAFVLHQHGPRRAHLHVLGSGDLLSNAAFSATFGHSGRRESDWQEPGFAATYPGVRILAIIPTSSMAVSTPRDDSLECSSTSLQDCSLVWFVDDEGPAAVHDSSSPIQQSRSASAVLLLRNHTLLI